jgi:MFS transporter, DHA1 family, tetracycline resistance protein
MRLNPKKNRTLFVIFFTNLLNSIGVSIIIPVVALLFIDDKNAVFGHAFTVETKYFVLGLLKAAYPIAQFIGAPILGALSDRMGRKPVLIYSIAGSVTGYILIIAGIMYQDIGLVFIGRITDGLTGGNISVIYSAVADISDSKQKPKNFGLIGMAFGFGFIIGPFLGGICSDPEIVPWFDFSTPFILAALLTLINLLLVLLWFPETYKGDASVKIRWHKTFKGLFEAFKTPLISMLLFVLFLFFLGFTFYTQFFDVFLIRKFSFGQLEIGNIYTYIGFWIVISQGLVTRIMAHYFAAQKIVAWSLLFLAVFMFSLLLPDKVIILLFLLPMVSMMHGLTMPNLVSIISDSAGKELQGRILGIVQSLQSLGFAISPILAGFLIAYDLNLPIILASLLIFFAFLSYLISLQQKQK